MLQIVLIGYGQIAKSQHVPVLRTSRAFKLMGVIDPQMDDADGLPCFPDLSTFFKAGGHCDCVAICTPPAIRYALAEAAMERRLHVLLEKPPVSSLSALFTLKQMAVQRGVSLFTGWHSRYAPCLPAIDAYLENRRVRDIEICWQEDHRKWHPGAQWLWRAGGFGAFDAGVNALSLLHAVMKVPLVHQQADMAFATGAETPIRAALHLSAGAEKIPVRAWFDIGAEAEDENWTITWRLEDGTIIKALEGGASWSVNGAVSSPDVADAHAEYRALYADFAHCIAQATSSVVAVPYLIATDCLAQGRRHAENMAAPDWVTPSREGGT